MFYLAYFFGMEIVLLSVNKVKNQNLKSLIDEYDKRIRHYIKFSHINISNIKNSKKSPLDHINNDGMILFASHYNPTISNLETLDLN